MEWLLIIQLMSTDGAGDVEMRSFETADQCALVLSTYLRLRNGRFVTKDGKCVQLTHPKP